MRTRKNIASVFAAALLTALAVTGALAELGSADVVLLAPIGAGTTGGASMMPASAPGTGGGSGAGGAALYFETANLDRGLPWNAIPATDWASWHRRTSSAGGRLPARLADGSDPSSIERRLVSSSCGSAPTTGGECFLWANSCPHGAQALHRRSFDGPADRGQIACRTSDWLRSAREFHSLSSWGEQAQMDELSHWNVQIWREGESRPIFERRVALDASGRPLADADAAGSSADWWRSGGGLGGVSGAAAGGPLGAWRDASDPDFQGCAARYRQAPRLIVGSFDVDGKPAKVAYRNGALSSTAPQVGSSTSKCYWGGWSNGDRTWLPGHELADDRAVRDLLLRGHRAVVADPGQGQLPRRPRPRELQLPAARPAEHVLCDPDRQPRPPRAAADDERAPAPEAPVLEPVLPRLRADRSRRLRLRHAEVRLPGLARDE